jgi:probable F420-dependent oxidoreductase
VRALRFSFVIFGVRADHSTALVRRAEALGFDTVWFGDHVATPMRIDSAYPYSASGRVGYGAETPLNDVWVAIAHAAALTSSIKLGPSVLILPLRHPVAVAQVAATAQNISGGRIVLGVGAGWLREEFDALGIPFETRGRRMDEALEIIGSLWTRGEVGFDGEHFAFAPITLGMTPSVPIPITVGGLSPPALRRAARADGWNGAEGELATAIRQREQLLELRAAADVSEQPFRFYVKPPGIEPSTLRAYRDAGFEDLVVPFRALYQGPKPVGLADRLAALDHLAEAIMLPDLV